MPTVVANSIFFIPTPCHRFTLQQGVIDGAENSEMALTTMKHGEVAPYFIYDQHQIMPDLLVCNLKFLNGLSPEEREVFDEAARISTQVEVEAWEKEIQVAKEQSIGMGVEFIDGTWKIIMIQINVSSRLTLLQGFCWERYAWQQQVRKRRSGYEDTERR